MNDLPVAEERYLRGDKACEYRQYRHRCQQRASYRIYLVGRPMQSLLVCDQHRAFARKAVQRLWERHKGD